MLADIVCPTGNTCVAVGDSGYIVASADGGTTWKVRPSGTSYNLTSITCPTAKVCLAVGWYGTITATTDGGVTWRAHHVQGGYRPTSIACSSAKACLAVGGGRAILASADGGVTWRALPYHDTAYTFALTDVTCSTGIGCLAVGYDTYGPIVLVLKSNGAFRRGVFVAALGGIGDLFAVSCPAGKPCLAVGYGGTVVQSEDGGATWTKRSDDSMLDLDSVACSTARACLAVGNEPAGSFFVESGNGGFIWAQRPFPVYGGSQIVCPTTKACLVVGDGGIILRSTGGAVV
jgi:photosystem II stability/assembly factor-like uncharacterized protein